MKKYIFFLVGAFLATGCSKNVSFDNQSLNNVVKINVTGERAFTKGVYNSSTGVFDWANGDQIGVYFTKGSLGNVAFNWTGGTVFESSVSISESDHYGKVAYYPYNGDANNSVTDDGTNYSGSTLYIHLKPTIEYNSSIMPLPLVANLGEDEDPTTIELKQVGAGVQVKLNNVPEEADKVTLTIDGKDITGWFEYDPAMIDSQYLGDGVVQVQDNAEKGSSVSYTFNHSNAEDMVFTFPIPAVSAPTIKVDLYVDDVIIATKKSGTLNDIQRGHILPMKALNVQDYAFYMVGDFNDWNLSEGRKQLTKVGKWQYGTVLNRFKLCFENTASDWSEVYGMNENNWFNSKIVRGSTGQNFPPEQNPTNVVYSILINGSNYYLIWQGAAQDAATYNDLYLVGSKIGWDSTDYPLTRDSDYPHIWTISHSFSQYETFKIRGTYIPDNAVSWFGFNNQDSYIEYVSEDGDDSNLKVNQSGTYVIILNDITRRFNIIKTD